MARKTVKTKNELSMLLSRIMATSILQYKSEDYDQAVEEEAHRLIESPNEFLLAIELISSLPLQDLSRVRSPISVDQVEIARTVMCVLRDRNVCDSLRKEIDGIKPITGIALAVVSVIKIHPSREVVAQLIHGASMLFGPHRIDDVEIRSFILSELNAASHRKDLLMGDRNELRDLIFNLKEA